MFNYAREMTFQAIMNSRENDMIIRKYRTADRDRLLEITAVCFEGVSIDYNIEELYGPVAGMNWTSRKKKHIEEDIAANEEGIFVAEEGGEAVGYITTRVNAHTRIGWIPNLSVLPDFQKRGIGRMLLDAAVDYLRRRGMLYARIETLEQNRTGSHFYPKYGFREIARQIHYIIPLESDSNSRE